MAIAIQSTNTKFGPVTVSRSGAGQSPIHTMANWMWRPMILMGVMSIATAIGLGVAQANVGADLGEEFTALRQANFETLKPLTAGFLFLGEALVLSGIAFLLGTILGALRGGGGEVQASLDAPVKTLKMPWSAKVFGDEKAFPIRTYQTPVHVETAAQAVWKGRRLLTPVGGGVIVRPRNALKTSNLLSDEDGRVAAVHEGVDLSKLPKDKCWWAAK